MVDLNRTQCQVVNGISGAKNSKDISALICPEPENPMKIIQNWGLGKMKDMTLSGSFEWEKMSGPFTIYRKEPDRYRLDAEIMGMKKPMHLTEKSYGQSKRIRRS